MGQVSIPIFIRLQDNHARNDQQDESEHGHLFHQ